jgi:protein tyrosine phosphatase (PTP) superfamily phosphohydrolase (DUF442 family)
MPARKLIPTLALGCVVLAGCRHHRPEPPPAYCPPPGRGMTIPPVGIPDGPPPPAPVPRGTAPDFGAVPAPAPPPGGSELLLPQNPPGRTRSEYPRAQYPQAIPPSRGGAVLGQPDYVERPRVVEAEPPADEPAPQSKRPATGDDRASGIPEFTQVKDGVSAGGRPELDGLDWLKARGYKTVVYIRRPGDDDTTDRRQVERRGMAFVSLLVTPDTLTKEWVDEFNRTIGDTGARPVFVYARDQAAAGAVWYLHLRTAEFLTHDEARIRAARLGLKDETSEMFQAAQKVLPKT